MIYVTGDMHGDAARLEAPAVRRLKKGDTLLVCGDFGFIWDGSTAEQKRLARIGKQKYTVAFLDGRHENFDLLAQYPVTEWNGGRAQVINDRLVHLLRGEIYQIEGKTFFVFGGGESEDREFRVPGKSWWAEEMPSPEEMLRAREVLAAHGNSVDYVLTHVPSRKVSLRLAPHSGSDGVSLFLGGLEDTVRCKKWFFGSLHLDRSITAQRVSVFEHVLPIDPPEKTGARHAK